MAKPVRYPVGESGEFPSIRLESPVAEYHSVVRTPLVDGLDHWLAVLQRFGIKTSAKLGGALGQVRAALQAGLPRHAFEKLRADLGVSIEELAEIVGIPVRTLARRTERFKPDESERLLRVGSVLKKALDVLEDPDAARRWMTQPKRALGGLTPLRGCDTDMGAREVEALLGRIEHGVFSWIPLEIPDDAVEWLDPVTLPPGWLNDEPGPASRSAGDTWLGSRRSAVLAVPSVVTSSEWNYLVNPLHPDFPMIQPGPAMPFRPDPRLIR